MENRKFGTRTAALVSAFLLVILQLVTSGCGKKSGPIEEGEEVLLHHYKSAPFVLATDMPSFETVWKAATAEAGKQVDLELAVKNLEAADKVFWIHQNPVKIKVIEIYVLGDRMKVQVLEGKYADREGWVPAEWVKREIN